MTVIYALTLISHRWIRWILLLGSAGLAIASGLGWIQGRPWGGAYKKATIFMAVAASIQFLLGVSLHLVFGSYLKALATDPAAFFRVKELRFFGMEHPIASLLAIGLIHMGLAKARRKGEDEGPAAHKLVALTELGAFLLLLVATPWWRPMFP
jgi:hypothetical protein